MIRGDWHLSAICLQIMAEQGPGMAFARSQADEDRELAASLKALS